MKMSILLTTHRYGGCDIFFAGIECQIFPRADFEIIWCDKLYDIRKEIVEKWAKENSINVIHFAPENNSKYHVHSSVLNECLKRASGEYCLVIGDYSYMEPDWISVHYQYNNAGYALSGLQKIYGLPKLSPSLEHPISVFIEDFTINTLKLLPEFYLIDPKFNLPNGALIDHRYCYNRNESFLTKAAIKIGGWDERYNNRTGESNKEFYLRLIYEGGEKIAYDKRAQIHRIMSNPIPPFTEFLCDETDSSINHERYALLCKKYGANE